MKSFKTRGIVIRERDAGETDKQLTLLTKTYGKIIVSAKGARKSRSKFLSGTQLFSYSDFIIYDGKRFYTIAQVDVIEGFFSLGSDYVRLCLAQYLVEVCDKTTPLNAPCDDLLHLLIISLSALAKGVRLPHLVVRAFEIKFFQLSGIAPETECCAKCGGSLSLPIRFCAEGTVCDCYKQFAVKISPAALHAIKYILSAELSNIFKFKIGEEALNEMKNAARLFFNCNFEAVVKSLDLLESKPK